jgi:hypothetical protein
MNTEEILIKIKMIEEGILPVKNRSELYAMLKTLTAEESRVFKRKFRKKWRKIAKSSSKSNQLLRLGEKNPGSGTSSARIYVVYSDARSKAIKD